MFYWVKVNLTDGKEYLTDSTVSEILEWLVKPVETSLYLEGFKTGSVQNFLNVECDLRVTSRQPQQMSISANISTCVFPSISKSD